MAEREGAGRVDIVGAGPGAADLLTVRARDLLAAAEVVVHDRLVSDAVLAFAPGARRIDVGKTPDGPSWRQADIDALLVSLARAGARVVRLKSGDPGVYGRLDEEMDALDAAGVPFEICPGVTAALAAAASARVSLTRRGRNSSLRVLTGRDVDGFAEHDWRALAAPGATAAIYMGVGAADFLRTRLLRAGADPSTPVTAVDNASRPNERTAAAVLGELPDALRRAGVSGPSILLLGLSPRDAAPRAAEPSAPTLAALRAAGDFL
jgi:uroporphyrin-III C-methyltransferase